VENEDDDHHRDAENEKKDYEVAEVVAAQLGTVTELGGVNGFREFLAVLLKNVDGLRKFIVLSVEGLLCVGAEGKRVLACAAWPLRRSPPGGWQGGEHWGSGGWWRRAERAGGMTARDVALLSHGE
jgi:hypothetical protein